ncbi:MAG: 16S rRNA (guanine(527)-N(7))-methyltransferase RsmG [bacterium]
MDLEEACRALGLELSDSQLALLRRYLDLLVHWNRRLDLVAPAAPDELLRAHVLDSLLLLATIRPPEGGAVADVGSGAGLPGVVWAVARPDLWVLLLEPRRKRAAFLERVALELKLANVQVEPVRAEEAAANPQYARRFHVVVARAVAGPHRLLQLAGGLVTTGGLVAVPVGPDAEVLPPFREVSWPVPWEPGKTRRVAVVVAWWPDQIFPGK